MWPQLLAEFLGTFTLVFIGAGTAALATKAVSESQFGEKNSSLIVTSLAFGIALMVIIYLWGSSSGAHVNPAVSLGFAMTDQITYSTMSMYWIAQILGAITAAAVLAYIIGTESGLGASVGSLTYTSPWKAVFIEAIITFFLVSAIFAMTSNKKYTLISGIVIGITLIMGILFAGPLTGGSMNPARSLGPAIFTNNMKSIWIYIVGPFIGAILAVFVYYGLYAHQTPV